MSKESDTEQRGTMKRRDFLSSAAMAATLVPPALMAQGSRGTTAAQGRIRVGIIGAGANARNVQIPGFLRIPECEILAVANRSLASSQRVADEFDIPRAYADWEELLADDEIDAVLIGTWPYMHRAITLAALQSGKHVLCQARMANDAAEAHQMLDASLRHSNLVCQLVPTSGTYRIDTALQRLLSEGYVGELLSVEVQRMQRRFTDIDGELDWRHDAEFSGYNVLNLGGTYESTMRWFGAGRRVMAMSKTHVPFRRNADGEMQAVGIPDHIDVLYELENGAQVHMKFSETSGLSSGNQTWIFGSEGTIYVDGSQNILIGRRGDSELTMLDNPREGQAFYRVEEEFINAIRGIEEVSLNTFEIGVQYMEFTEAVYRSAESGAAIDLPLSI